MPVPVEKPLPPLDLTDIQGNILRGYRREVFARFLFLRIGKAEDGRKYLGRLLEHATPANWGDERPQALTNIALSHAGLCALGLSYESSCSFPADFRQGMKARAKTLGDTGGSAPDQWDEPWRTDDVHLLVSCYARDKAQLKAHCDGLLKDLPAGVRELPPHQDGERFTINDRQPEHFGFADGLSNPDVEGMPPDAKLVGNPDPDSKSGFSPVPAGEFILGYPGLGREQRDLPIPGRLAVNGTFMVFRKLAQDVNAFRTYLKTQHETMSKVISGQNEEFIAAKMVGRWPDGSPLVLHAEQRNNPTNKFDYTNDPEGAMCPLGAHIRRANPRSSQGLNGDLSKRRRMIRRGIPYGTFVPKGQDADATPRGLLFVAYVAGIEAQFEFVQGQWVNHGNDFRQGSDKDPVAGDNNGFGRMVIPGDERAGRPPFLCTGLPRFVTVKGGGYFFVPGLTALRLMAAGHLQ
jgi:Dyp-type peroxidase family